jgi:hypothetical protein
MINSNVILQKSMYIAKIFIIKERGGKVLFG